MNKKAIFFDRDGVLNVCPPFVNKPEDLKIIPGTHGALQKLSDAGYNIHVVTNQGGIGLGYMKLETMEKINQKTIELLPMITSIEFCPHKPKAGCSCRKPNPGMISKILAEYKYDPMQCWLVGDMETDIEAGINAGLPRKNMIMIESNLGIITIATQILKNSK